ncbi:MAG TPA: Sec-independent protein translocase protein TatB [Actinomycetota bacterium]|nr:Sec-independent protein translocase protein TatB [Actinomycetota bacterium]
MPQIGPLEIVVVAMIALIVFGPEKLPGLARSIGRAMNELRRMASEVKTEFTADFDDEAVAPEPPAPEPTPRATPRETDE